MSDYQKVIENKIKFHHNLEPGLRVYHNCFRQKPAGKLVRIVVCEGSDRYGKCEVEWSDGTTSLEHPEHLSAGTQFGKTREECLA